METRIVDLGPCTKEIEVSVPPEKIQEALDRSFNELRTQIALPGFRPGRVPRSVIERRFGDHVRHEVLHDLVREGIEEAVKEHKLDIVSEPELKGHDEGTPEHALPAEGPLTFTFTVDVKPEFDLPQYKGVDVVRRLKPVTDEHVDKVLGRLAGSRAQWIPAPDETWRAGDLVMGTLTLHAEGKTVMEAEEVSFLVEAPLVDEGVKLENVVELVNGRKPGETVTATAVLGPTFKDEALRNKTATGPFVLSEFKRRTVPPLGDDLAKEAGFENLDALKADIRSRLESQNRAEADRQVVRDVIDRLLDQVEIPLAAKPTERMVQRRLAAARGESEDEDGSGEAEAEAPAPVSETVEKNIRATVERDSRSWLLLEKIAKREKIFCLEEDVDREIAQIAGEIGQAPSKVREIYTARDMMGELRLSIIERKTCEFLREHARITDESWGSATDSLSGSTGDPAVEGDAGSAPAEAGGTQV